MRGKQTARQARLSDLDALIRLEQECFPRDAQSRRSLRYLLTRANARLLLIDGPKDGVAAALTLLFRKGSRVARIYSIAVAPACRGQALADRLMQAALTLARAQDCDQLSAEVRAGNTASLALFDRHHFKQVGRLAGYYPDGEDAVKLRRRLVQGV